MDAECLEENRISEKECGINPCPEIEDCSDFSVCSVTCGGGEESCERTCTHGGEWGSDCDIDQQVKTETCNDHLCREFLQN